LWPAERTLGLFVEQIQDLDARLRQRLGAEFQEQIRGAFADDAGALIVGVFAPNRTTL
jgi:hypothetical protein